MRSVASAVSLHLVLGGLLVCGCLVGVGALSPPEAKAAAPPSLPRPDAHGNRKLGKLGRDLNVEQGYQAARSVGMDLLAVMRAELGSLDRVKRVVKVLGMVNAVPEFTDHPKVINGCSDLFVEVLGDAGKHARSAVGMGSLPMGIPVEIECIVEVS